MTCEVDDCPRKVGKIWLLGGWVKHTRCIEHNAERLWEPCGENDLDTAPADELAHRNREAQAA